jgi:predicted N-formylglutamate amidohydrolase
LILTCEHAGNRIPDAYAHLFREAGEMLASHRGWDPGALAFVRGLSRRLRTPFHHVAWSRLLVEANRAPTNPRIWSPFTKDLPIEERRKILETYWWPHRRAVEAAVRDAHTRGKTALHIAVHSFTGVLHGATRNADVSFLYDSSRPAEKALCIRWQHILHALDPTLRVRRNYPYRGRDDGLPTWLRNRFPARNYLGVELEFNQNLLDSPRFAHVQSAVAESLRTLHSVCRHPPES